MDESILSFNNITMLFPGVRALFLHLMDFTGKKVLNYRFDCGYGDNDAIPLGNPPNPPNNTIFEFSGEQAPPGCPFLFVTAEVM